MKSRKLLDALENVNDEYIEAAASSGAKKRPRRPVWIAAVACVALLLIGSAVGHRLKSLPAEPVTDETTVAGNITAEIDTDFSSAVGEPDSELPIATKPEPPASTKDAGEPTQVHLPNKPDEPAHAVAPTVVFNGENYIICGSAGEGEILKKVGLPENLTADCAGRHVAYITPTVIICIFRLIKKPILRCLNMPQSRIKTSISCSSTAHITPPCLGMRAATAA